MGEHQPRQLTECCHNPFPVFRPNPISTSHFHGAPTPGEVLPMIFHCATNPIRNVRIHKAVTSQQHSDGNMKSRTRSPRRVGITLSKTVEKSEARTDGTNLNSCNIFWGCSGNHFSLHDHRRGVEKQRKQHSHAARG